MKRDIPCRFLACVMENRHTKSMIVMAKSRTRMEEKNTNDDCSDEMTACSGSRNGPDGCSEVNLSSCGPGTITNSTNNKKKQCEKSSLGKKRKIGNHDDQAESEQHSVENSISPPKAKKKRPKKKDMYRPIITNTCILPTVQPTTNGQNPHSFEKFEKQRLPMIVTPEEALEKNKNKDIQIQIYVKPLLVLDINGILCHRVRGENIPSNLLSKLLETAHIETDEGKDKFCMQDKATSGETKHEKKEDDKSLLQMEVKEPSPSKPHQHDFRVSYSNENSLESLPTSFSSRKQKSRAIREQRIKAFCRSLYRSPIGHIAGTPIVARTDLHDLLSYLDQHFTLAIWSSAKRKTVKGLVKILFPDDIASKLLFVWHQSKCECVDATKLGEGKEEMVDDRISKVNDRNPNCDKQSETGNEEPSVQRKLHHDDIIYVKYLSKVWAQYPAWNESNTLLIDDSPEKCPLKYQSNAVFPPPITGLNISAIRSKLTDVEGNENKVEIDGVAFSDHENQLKQRNFFTKLTSFFGKSDARNEEPSRNNLHSFLQESATEHMSWRESVC